VVSAAVMASRSCWRITLPSGTLCRPRRLQEGRVILQQDRDAITAAETTLAHPAREREAAPVKIPVRGDVA